MQCEKDEQESMKRTGGGGGGGGSPTSGHAHQPLLSLPDAC